MSSRLHCKMKAPTPFYPGGFLSVCLPMEGAGGRTWPTEIFSSARMVMLAVLRTRRQTDRITTGALSRYNVEAVARLFGSCSHGSPPRLGRSDYAQGFRRRGAKARWA